VKAQEYIKERGLEEVKEMGCNSGSQSSQVKFCLIFPLKDRQSNMVSLAQYFE